jgi:hypothetical protein
MSLLACTAIAGSASAAVSVFDFDGNYNASAGPAVMSEFGPSMGTFGTDTIAGQNSGVFNFSGAAPKTQGLLVTHGAPPNGGGSYVNQFTLGYDIKWPDVGGYSSLLQTGIADTSDGDLFLHNGGFGISSNYQGSIAANNWYRLMFVFDLKPTGSDSMLYKYVDGAQVGSQKLSAGADGRWSLDPSFLLFGDEDGESKAGSISSFYFNDQALTADSVAAFGRANAGGFLGGDTAVPEPATLSLLALGVIPALRRRKTAR